MKPEALAAIFLKEVKRRADEAVAGEVRTLASAGANLGGYLINEDLSRSRVVGHFGAGGKFKTMTGRWLEMPSWITNQVASFYALLLADIAKTRAAVKDLIYDARPADKDKLRALCEFLDRNLGFELFREIDEAKIALSSAESAAIAYARMLEAAFPGRVRGGSRLHEHRLRPPRGQGARPAGPAPRIEKPRSAAYYRGSRSQESSMDSAARSRSFE